jgi:hypothetical protein
VFGTEKHLFLSINRCGKGDLRITSLTSKTDYHQTNHTAKGFLPGISAVSLIPIDLVLIDPQSVGKRTHDLMDTVNAKRKRDGRPFIGVSINI